MGRFLFDRVERRFHLFHVHCFTMIDEIVNAGDADKIVTDLCDLASASYDLIFRFEGEDHGGGSQNAFGF